MKISKLFAAFALFFLLGTARADLSGVVVAVLDGDTVDVLVDRKPVRVRLAEIDAPEKAQAFGTTSRQTLAAAVFRQGSLEVVQKTDVFWTDRPVVFSRN